jgi:hypothetical protein
VPLEVLEVVLRLQLLELEVWVVVQVMEVLEALRMRAELLD